jgi:hypothetical protein
MKKLLSLSCLALAAACTMNEPADPDRGATRESLSAALANYRADGPPVSCVDLHQLQGNHSVGDAIVFEGNGGRLWVNRPAGGCPDLGYGRALQTRTTSTRLCRGDIATVFDTASRMQYGACGLGDFEPYRRVRR